MTIGVTHQQKKWSGRFGNAYISRNDLNAKELDNRYQSHFGVTRSELNQEFIGQLDRDIPILEVGSNIGNQLLLLKKMGFRNLYGIEINIQAIKEAKKRLPKAHIIKGCAEDIPFKNGYFDLVYTSGVLIHISPRNIKQALCEISRCAKRYIWGFEYFSEKYVDISYRNNNDLLWKADFASLYTKYCPEWRAIKTRKVPYLSSDNVDAMFLLKKKHIKKRLFHEKND